MVKKHLFVRTEAFTTMRIMFFFWILVPTRLAEALKIEIVCFSETLTNIGKSAQRQNPEEQRHHSFLCFRAP
jgi:hypothetical protein